MTEIPKRAVGRDPKWGRLFKSCTSVGFSFFVPSKVRSQVQFGSTVNLWNKRLAPWHFVTRSNDAKGNLEQEGGKKGFRVWRDK